MTDHLKLFTDAMSEPAPPATPTAAAPTTCSLKVACSDACGCGCGRPAGVLVLMPGRAAVLDSPERVDLLIRTLAAARDELWPRPLSWTWFRRGCRRMAISIRRRFLP